MTIARKPALGRGLAALLGDDSMEPTRESSREPSGGSNSEVNSHEGPLDQREPGAWPTQSRRGGMPLDSAEGAGAYRDIGIDQLCPSAEQPRRHIDSPPLEELAASIKKYGILQPLIVGHPENPRVDPRYRIIAGERRWRAAKMAGLQSVPAIVHAMGSQSAMEVALVENIQRVNLTPLEEAMAYENLMELYNFSQERLAGTLGKSRSHITNMLRLNKLHPAVKKALQDGKITYGHARCLVNQGDAEKILARIIDEGLSVRDTEAMMKTAGAARGSRGRSSRGPHGDGSDEAASWRPEEILSLEEALGRQLKTRVKIVVTDREKKIVIYFDDYNQFDDIIRNLA